MKDVEVVWELYHLPSTEDRGPLLKKISLACRWALTTSTFMTASRIVHGLGQRLLHESPLPQ